MADPKAAGAKPRPDNLVLAAYLADLERRGYSPWWWRTTVSRQHGGLAWVTAQPTPGVEEL